MPPAAAPIHHPRAAPPSPPPRACRTADRHAAGLFVTTRRRSSGRSAATHYRSAAHSRPRCRLPPLAPRCRSAATRRHARSDWLSQSPRRTAESAATRLPRRWPPCRWADPPPLAALCMPPADARVRRDALPVRRLTFSRAADCHCPAPLLADLIHRRAHPQPRHRSRCVATRCRATMPIRRRAVPVRGSALSRRIAGLRAHINNVEVRPCYGPGDLPHCSKGHPRPRCPRSQHLGATTKRHHGPRPGHCGVPCSPLAS